MRRIGHSLAGRGSVGRRAGTMRQRNLAEAGTGIQCHARGNHFLCAGRHQDIDRNPAIARRIGMPGIARIAIGETANLRDLLWPQSIL